MSLRDELLAIHGQHGNLNPSLVVEYASDNEGSELHRHLFLEFEDEKAAAVGRLHRARMLIKKYRVVDNRSPGEEGPRDVRERIRLFSAMPSTDDPSKYDYHPTEDVITDPIGRAVLLREAERQWKALKARYGHLKEFAEMILGDLGDQAA